MYAYNTHLIEAYFAAFFFFCGFFFHSFTYSTVLFVTQYYFQCDQIEYLLKNNENHVRNTGGQMRCAYTPTL